MLSSQHAVGHILGSVIDLNGPGHYIHWGFVQMSVANLVVIVAMVIVLIAAILLPFPHRRERGR
jgi:galactitol-specific phosphotransferase system IIC component